MVASVAGIGTSATVGHCRTLQGKRRYMDGKTIGFDKTLSPTGGNGGGYALSAGDVLGQYRVVRPLGRGGMAEVYEVEHGVLRRRYALKLLPAELARSGAERERFRREAQVMANLEHPNIVRVDEFGETDGRYWLRMELAEGVDVGDAHVHALDDYVKAKGGRFAAAEAEAFFRRILEGLAYAHSKGAVHRDLKPGNILLFATPDGGVFPKISDFGLVRLVGEEWVRSQAELSVRQSVSIGGEPTMAPEGAGSGTRSLLGTYEYMSPEQKRAEEATPASDVYAVGLMMYRLLTGRQLGMKRPSELVPGLPAWWDDLVAAALEHDPADRFADAAGMLMVLVPDSGEQAREEAERKAEAAQKAEAERKTKEAAEQKEEAQRKAREAAEQKEEAQRKAREEAEQVAKREQEEARYHGQPEWSSYRAELVAKHEQEEAEDQARAEAARKAAERQARREAFPAVGMAEGQPWTVPGLGMELIHVAPGSFRMGSDSGRDNEKPVHTVRISRGYWLGMYPVTQAEYEDMMGCNPSHFQDEIVVKPGFLGFGRETTKRSRGRHPVECVSWDDAMAFCKKLTERERAAGRLPAGHAFRLPTEAEWEYAAGGGTQSKGFTYSGSDNAGEVAWHCDNSDRKTHPVGQKKPNELGLYDMSGNVWEWCQDHRYDAYPSGAVTDPPGAGTGQSRVCRGGSWIFSARDCRSAYRIGFSPSYSHYNLGFRVALAPVR
jgi:formylglycine-generating enzyme required for sulfatase activity/tRNA A-37 threonylcarbamoyl transferase component Bud32